MPSIIANIQTLVKNCFDLVCKPLPKVLLKGLLLYIILINATLLALVNPSSEYLISVAVIPVFLTLIYLVQYVKLIAIRITTTLLISFMIICSIYDISQLFIKDILGNSFQSPGLLTFLGTSIFCLLLVDIALLFIFLIKIYLENKKTFELNK